MCEIVINTFVEELVSPSHFGAGLLGLRILACFALRCGGQWFSEFLEGIEVRQKKISEGVCGSQKRSNVSKVSTKVGWRIR